MNPRDVADFLRNRTVARKLADGSTIPAPPPVRTIRLNLGEHDFRQLCAGQVVRLRAPDAAWPIEITLADIGIVPMLRAVVDPTNKALAKMEAGAKDPRKVPGDE